MSNAQFSHQILTRTGETRTQLRPTHALIAPDGNVPTQLPGWSGCTSVILISPQMGARFCQYRISLADGATSGPPLPGVERFVYVLSGTVALEAGGTAGSGASHSLTASGYAWLPPDTPHTIRGTGEAVITVVERRYLEVPGVSAPPVVVGNARDLVGEAFLGDENLTVRKLLPDEPAFDMAMNTMTFRPGTPLPFVETHFMEHGLVMLAGGGIYRLDNQWYPVTAEDVIWMGPYCPQWFAAVGREEAAYLLYKEANRDPFRFERES